MTPETPAICLEKNSASQLIDVTIDGHQIKQDIPRVKLENQNVRGEIFTHCMDSHDDPGVGEIFDAIDYDGNPHAPESERKYVSEKLISDHDPSKHCKPWMFRGVSNITFSATDLHSGRLYLQRELWDWLLEHSIGFGLIFLLIGIIFCF